MILNEKYIDRETSWVQFNHRVLAEAMDPRTPLLDRVRFLEIATTNLDEFYMKRAEEILSCRTFASGLSGVLDPFELLKEVRKEVELFYRKRDNCWEKDLVPELGEHGIFILKGSELREKEVDVVQEYFDQNVFPVLTPFAVDSGHPFPFISNLSVSLGVFTLPQNSDRVIPEKRFTRIKVPQALPSWFRFPRENKSEYRFVSIVDVIQKFLPTLFPETQIIESMAFRVTRNIEIDSDEDAPESLLKRVALHLKQRRFADVVRLELENNGSSSMTRFLKESLDIHTSLIHEVNTRVDFSRLKEIWSLDYPKKKYSGWRPVPVLDFQNSRDVFEIIRGKDLLVHHPYESFSGTVEEFVSQASRDPDVVSIKMTLYRTGSESPFIPNLIYAAEHGKQVVCVVELKARLDEHRNIQVARALEKAGVHVVYGMAGLKTHCKAALVIREEHGEMKSYAHIGTGNYHAETSQVYTDWGFFTADPVMGRDLVHLFHSLTRGTFHKEYRKLLVSPIQMKDRFLDKIKEEARFAQKNIPSRIIAKMNSLEDPEIINALYEASQAGVSIQLLVRGFCCLRPGIPGLSEGIAVQSSIGRFLEHSRVYCFQSGKSDMSEGDIFIGSADWMRRNLMGRVEVLAPIRDGGLKHRILDELNLMIKDQRQTWDLDSDGNYVQRMPRCEAEKIGFQEKLTELYQTVSREVPAIKSLGVQDLR